MPQVLWSANVKLDTVLKNFLQRVFKVWDNRAMSERLSVFADRLDLARPGRRDYFVCLEHPTLWGFIRIPVTVWVGKKAGDGEGILAIGSTHGDEYEGPVALKRLLHEIDIEAVDGRLILVPILNPAAFESGVRDTPFDGVNLNRAFPGSAEGSLTFQIAHFVERFLFPHAHVVIDIHSGGLVARFPLLAEFHAVEDPARRLDFESAARGFGTRFVQIYQNRTLGLLTSRAEELGKISIGTELGWGRGLFAPGVRCARRGVLWAARAHRQWRGEVEDPLCGLDEQVLVDTSGFESSLLAPASGVFEPTIDLGDRVREGDPVGFLHNFDHLGERPLSLRAPHDGFIICLNARARVFNGQVVCQVGRVVPWS